MHFSLMLAAVIAAGSIGAYYAEKRGRSPITWFIVGLCFGFIGVLTLFFLPSLKPIKEKSQSPTTSGNINPNQTIIDLYNQREWFYLDQQANHQGPYTFEWLRDLWKQNKLIDQSYVWSEGMENWQRIQELPGFGPKV